MGLSFFVFVLLLILHLSLTLAKDIPNERSMVVLETDNIQTASQHDGLPVNNSIGYVPSSTDAANFINYCTKKTLTNGRTLHVESCNGIVMGDIPSPSNMISTLITHPFPGQTLARRTSFIVKFQVTNLITGSATNPENTFYSAPQALRDGKVVGHVQVTIQSLLVGEGPPDPARFVFFRTVFGNGDGTGTFDVLVDEGLEKGFYRVCTVAVGRNYQPVIMPVVERGAQDDCQKFLVG